MFLKLIGKTMILVLITVILFGCTVGTPPVASTTPTTRPPSTQAVPLFVPAPVSPLAVERGPGHTVLADINGDAHLDLLTKHLLDQSLAIRFGDGQGRFVPVPGSPMRFDYQPRAVAFGDVNRDSILDLGVANKGENTENVAVFLGDGRAGFRLAPGSPFTASASMEFYKPSLRFVDIDEDGMLDIVTANGQRNTVEIFFGDGLGGFLLGPAVKLEPSLDLYSFGLGDVDGDGHLDLVTSSNIGPGPGLGGVLTRLGDGKGAFRGALRSPLSVPPSPRVAALGDLNGDTLLDIVLSHADANLLSVLLSEGNGMFVPATGSPYSIRAPAFAVVIAEVNGDQKNDLVAASQNWVTVLLGEGPRFGPALGSPFVTGPGCYNVTVGDINEDGKLDVAASSFEGNTITILLGQ